MSISFTTPALHRVLIVLLAAALVATVACGSDEAKPSAPPAAKSPAAPTPDAPAPVAKPAAPAPEASISEGEVPAGYPSDLPVYPGAVAGTSLGIPGGPLLVTFKTDDARDEVSKHLESALGEGGWSVSNQGDGKFEAIKGEKVATFRVDAETGGGSTIAVTVTGG